MTTRNKIAVDRLVGLPLAWVLNLAARLLGRIMRRDHSCGPHSVRTVVIAKYVGMGSIIQATPLIRSVRESYPGARIVFVTGRACRAFVERLEHIDEVVVVDDRGFLRVAWTSLLATVRLIRMRVDVYFDLELYSAYASIMALICLSRNRAGFFRQSAEHKRGNYTHLMYFNTRHPVRHAYLQLGRMVGCEPAAPDTLGKIRIGDEERDELTQKLACCGITTGTYMVVNANASDLLVERRWPAERFAELAPRLVAEFGSQVLFVGTRSERDYVEAVLELVQPEARPGLFNFAGELSLGAFIALLEGARCVVTNDTGPMHMAWAVGAPSVCLFGPGTPEHYGWDSPRTRILYKQLYCSPCLYEVDVPPCAGNNVCMKRITVEEVLEATADVLQGRSPRRGKSLRRLELVDDRAEPLGNIRRREPTS